MKVPTGDPNTLPEVLHTFEANLNILKRCESCGGGDDEVEDQVVIE